MNKKQAWKVKQKLVDRFLDVLADNGFEWRTGHKANGFRPLEYKETLLFVEQEPKILMYMGYSYYLDKSDEEYNITEVTEELLDVMESEGVESTIVSESDSKDLWKLICGGEECGSDVDNVDGVDNVDNVDDVDVDNVDDVDVDDIDNVDEKDNAYKKDKENGIDDLFEMLFGGHKIPDPVNHPSHYKGLEGLEVRTVQENFVPKYEKYGVMVACDIKDSIKYILRAPDKNGVEDLKKAIRMLNYAIEGWENEQ